MNITLKILTKKMKSKRVSDPERKKFTNMRIKARNFLENVSYSRLDKKDVETRMFISSVLVMLAQDVNPTA